MCKFERNVADVGQCAACNRSRKKNNLAGHRRKQFEPWVKKKKKSSPEYGRNSSILLFGVLAFSPLFCSSCVVFLCVSPVYRRLTVLLTAAWCSPRSILPFPLYVAFSSLKQCLQSGKCFTTTLAASSLTRKLVNFSNITVCCLATSTNGRYDPRPPSTKEASKGASRRGLLEGGFEGIISYFFQFEQKYA